MSNETSFFSLTNGKHSTVTRHTQKPAITTNNKDIPDETDQSGNSQSIGESEESVYGIFVDEGTDEEDESDNDHPASDPDFSGTRRTNATQLVLLYSFAFFHFGLFLKCSSKKGSCYISMNEISFSHLLISLSSFQRPAVNHFQVSICPLANKSYGIDLNKHPLRHVPCTRSNISSIYLFTHLRVFHCLSSKASCMYYEN